MISSRKPVHWLIGGTAALVLALPLSAQTQQRPAAGAGAAPAPVAAPANAPGGVFRCVDADGKTEYRNIGDTKGCKKIETETVNTVPFPRPTTARPDAKSPNRIEAGAQRGRDNDRRKILEEELASEQKRLSDLRSEFNNGEPERRGDERNFQRYADRVEKLKADIARSEANVESLKRELASARN